MAGFRLIGLLTSSKNSTTKSIEDKKKFLKVLQHDEFYSFYSCYTYDQENNLFSYSRNEDLSDLNIYNSGSDLQINISALVGKNGSGKSTLIELLYLANYNLGCEYKLLNWFKKHGDSIRSGEESLDIGDYIPYKKKELYFTILFERDGDLFQLVFDGIDIILNKNKSSKSIGAVEFSSVNLFENDKKENNFECLFYTIAVNYSIYGLNSNFMGNWIKPLFHKNDGYRTPLVINPMRTDGNFDINDETDFTYNRILANLISKRLKQIKRNEKSEIYLSDKQWVTKIVFKLKSEEIKENVWSVGQGIAGEREPTRLVADIIHVFFPDLEMESFDLEKKNLPFIDHILNYLTRKYSKIVKTYKEYNDNQDLSELTGDRKQHKILTILLEDNSHITYKFRQAINFLKTNIELEKRIKWEVSKEVSGHPVSFEFTLDELIDWMGIKDNELITELLPPSIFNTEIYLSTPNNENDCTFGDLSSGEQQYINSIQTILYHINNLNSVHSSAVESRIKYTDVNVIFDEVELYFHPELQQRFISEIIEEIKSMELGSSNGVNSINILFSTHSPFILSDIPSNNILRLKDGAMEDTKFNKSFGANIHDLLANEFFLKKGFTGEFAKEKINETIQFLTYHINTKEIGDKSKDIIPEHIKLMIDFLKSENNFIKNELKIDVSIDKKRNHYDVIGLIGEKIIKVKLKEMYKLAFGEYV